jgi:Nucleotidyl transferase AbiEii toxin, Type IV TA system
MSSAQQAVLRRLGPVAAHRGFYLAGGTAVALRLGHRRSLDLDWFTGDPLADPQALAGILRQEGVPLRVLSTDAGTLHVEVDGVRLSFLEYRYPLLRPTELWSEFGCRLAAVDDLSCMKLSALAGRGARKDFLDVWALARAGPDLPAMLDAYRRKFAVDDVGHVIMSLTYFDDADDEEPPDMIWDTPWEDVKRMLEGWVRDLVERGLGQP